MAILDELPSDRRAWLDCLDETTFDVFERLDAVFDPAERVPWNVKLADTPMGRLAKESGGAEWRALGLWGQLRLHISVGKGDYHRALTSVFTPVLRRAPRWTPAEIELLWRVAVTPTPLGRDQQPADLYRLPLAATRRLPVAEREPYVEFLRQVKDHLAQRPWGATDSVKRVIDNLLADHAGDPAVAAQDLINELDPFATLLREEYAARFGTPEVLPLLRHWTTATNPRPNAAWLDQAAALLTPDAVTLVKDVLGRIPGYRERVEPHPYRPVVTYFHEHTAVLVRGMVWTCELVGEPWVTALLGDVAVATGTGVGGSGPDSRNERTTNAALGVLARRGGLEAVTQLARVQAKVRRKSILALVARTLDGVAEQTGLSPEQLLDRTVPSFGLGPDGTRTEHGLRLSADGVIAFVDEGGKVRKTIPKAVRSAHGELLAELRATAKELRKTLPAERFRVERALAGERIWCWRDICAHYLDHPVTGRYGKALIWEIPQGPAGLPVRAAGGWELADPQGRSIRPLPDTPVKLWHPISAAVDEVRAWRDHVLAIGLRQPFKQAFREVYLLTPAEESAGDRSRRFAGHVLRYGQAKALLTERGWTGLSLGHWWAEGGYNQAEAVKELPGLTARWDFHLDEESGERDAYGTASLCVSGDIRFTDEHGRRVSPAEVPPRVLSEALRDADLAVGVTSTGLDPEGQDDYWHSYNLGDLTGTAQVRRDALTRLVPRLAIADRLELTDRFLRVRGDLRTYRIHLGSGNILMEPNDAYLCIVPRGATDHVFLPFEEDGGMLSAIVSKAFLLVADTTITDPSIAHQLR
ncbi:DUF4132 domain-containing protein [Streptosporangium roseum]|uniref:Uncharacterized protein n=1 Tax=Streptosporangium roseum (strain ATCC 12428 / DSM 43021 / JCM 3005 / KCTC 9067 / NCIMB 10171 / NRRL 2505 / NI 9100) TaxID=479432 RepID=D2BAK9_STRRD|nr:DUF4132 domain-containing protein [Streptosporangium roseum]ACZ89839.1 hypothetical protein Sros_7144 [Streptosporangium roseum DSM 43021]